MLQIFFTINQQFCLVEQADLFAFPPICLPQHEQDFGGLDGIVAGASQAGFDEYPLPDPTRTFILLPEPDPNYF